jgi:hypothetical protein
MGSLILLLLVIDRRARVVARAKALRASAELAAEDEKAAAKRRAEWENRRRLLHEQLAEQDQRIVAQINSVSGNAEATVSATGTEQAQHRELRERLRKEQSELALWEEKLTAQRNEVQKAAQETKASQAEMAALTAELEELERTLADLKLARRKQQQMYSLVPYSGKRGDNRRPLYIECTSAGLIFHPEKLALQGSALTPQEIRAEIERRLAATPATPTGGTDRSKSGAYLLMLVRPSGITSYYRMLAALQALKVDFGYEFIDADWILDFGGDGKTLAEQPWMAARKVESWSPGPSRRKVEGLRSSPMQLAADSGQNVFRKTPVGSSGTHVSAADEKPVSGGSSRSVAENRRGAIGAPGVGTVPGTSRPEGGGLETTAGSHGVERGSGTPGRPGTAQDIMTPGAGTVSGTSRPDWGGFEPKPGSPDLKGGSSTPGSPGAPQGIMTPGVGTVPGPSRTEGGGFEPTAGSHGVEGGSGMPGSPVAPQDIMPTPPGTGRDYAGARPAASRPVDQGFGDTVPGGPLTGGVPQGGAAAEPGGGLSAPSSAVTILPAIPPGGTRTDAHAAAGGMSSPSGGGSPPDKNAETAEERSGAFHDPLGKMVPPELQKRVVRPLPFTGLLSGNRDWIIAVECTRDSLVVSPSGQRIATAELSEHSNSGTVLLDTVRQLVARRQATLRPGETPYRPMIRLRVRPDGLRAYYLAYPILATLHLPMTRENIAGESGEPAP